MCLFSLWCISKCQSQWNQLPNSVTIDCMRPSLGNHHLHEGNVQKLAENAPPGLLPLQYYTHDWASSFYLRCSSLSLCRHQWRLSQRCWSLEFLWSTPFQLTSSRSPFGSGHQFVLQALVHGHAISWKCQHIVFLCRRRPSKGGSGKAGVNSVSSSAWDHGSLGGQHVFQPFRRRPQDQLCVAG